jgi:hypothetical protein
MPLRGFPHAQLRESVSFCRFRIAVLGPFQFCYPWCKENEMAKKIRIDDELLAQVELLANQTGTPLDEYIENTIKWALSNRLERDPLFANYQPYGGSTPSDLAENHDEHLYGDRS